MSSTHKTIADWLADARSKADAGTLGHDDLNKLAALLDEAAAAGNGAAGRRQRLLYLHASAPSMDGPVIGMAVHEPVAGGRELAGERRDWPYATVHDAVIDGCQVIHLPQQLAPFDDREIDIVGYEFVLQKWSDDECH